MKAQLIQYLEAGLNNSKIAKLINVHRTTVPKILNKHGLYRFKLKNFECKICEKDLGENVKNSSICNSCMTRVRRYRTKKRAVEYLGGCCIRCKYEKSLSALEFHHLDPEQKDFSISNQGNKSWTVIQKELDKCVLICSNCHHEEHSGYTDEKLLAYINKFGEKYGNK
jgi:superfamily II helicase